VFNFLTTHLGVPVSTSSNLIQVFDAAVPDNFLKDSLRCLHECANLASIYCAPYPGPERRYLQPHARRANVEFRWREIGERYATTHPVVSVTVKPNSRDSGDYTRITFGNVVLTESAVKNRCDIVRPADFRETLARSSAPWLFAEMEEEPPPPGALLYAILVYAAVGTTLVFADIVFPDTKCEHYLGRIRLFDRYPDLIATLKTPQEEIIKPVAEPQLRPKSPKPPKKAEGGA
jgi:hypothetical protein